MVSELKRLRLCRRLDASHETSGNGKLCKYACMQGRWAVQDASLSYVSLNVAAFVILCDFDSSGLFQELLGLEMCYRGLSGGSLFELYEGVDQGEVGGIIEAQTLCLVGYMTNGGTTYEIGLGRRTLSTHETTSP